MFYTQKAPDYWLKDLNKFDTDWHKEFLEKAPCLIVIFKQIYELKDNIKYKNYYVNESVGIACGFLLMAIHNAGLVALTHTPSPMGFLEKICRRPKNERAYLLIPIGYPKDETKIPDLRKKRYNEYAEIIYLWECIICVSRYITTIDEEKAGKLCSYCVTMAMIQML